MSNALCVAGAALIIVGVARISAPLALIVGGIWTLVVAINVLHGK